MPEVKTLNNTIDAVITWVNSSDIVWQRKISQHLEKKIDWTNKKQSTRYNSLNEVDITILSIIKYASFIKNIYLVTDNQTPENFSKLKKEASTQGINLEVKDHTAIFRGYEQYLPTFNSRSIITMLYRIPNLSERFVVFNDDTFLMRETTEEDFFKNNSPIIRGKWSLLYEDQTLRTMYLKIKSLYKKSKPRKSGYKLAQQKSAKLLGFKKYIRRDHTPVSICKSTLEEFFDSNELFLENNIKYKFRNKKQFLTTSLSYHLEVKKGDYILHENYNLSYFKSYKKTFTTKLKLFLFDVNSNKKFMCFQSLELAPKANLNIILKWIDHKLNTNFNESVE